MSGGRLGLCGIKQTQIKSTIARYIVKRFQFTQQSWFWLPQQTQNLANYRDFRTQWSCSRTHIESVWGNFFYENKITKCSGQMPALHRWNRQPYKAPRPPIIRHALHRHLTAIVAHPISKSNHCLHVYIYITPYFWYTLQKSESRLMPEYSCMKDNKNGCVCVRCVHFPKKKKKHIKRLQSKNILRFFISIFMILPCWLSLVSEMFIYKNGHIANAWLYNIHFLLLLLVIYMNKFWLITFLRA